jgi:hypothetical protein
MRDRLQLGYRIPFTAFHNRTRMSLRSSGPLAGLEDRDRGGDMGQVDPRLGELLLVGLDRGADFIALVGEGRNGSDFSYAPKCGRLSVKVLVAFAP